LMKAGHDLHVYDKHAPPVEELIAKGAKGSTDFAKFISGLSKPRAVWMMVPAAVVDSVLNNLMQHLEPGDIVIDGGNSYYHDDLRRSKALKP